jgi:hypothetical protein
MKKVLFAFVIVGLLSSCATIMKGTTSQVSFDSNPKGAQIYAVTKKGKIEIGTTPTVSTISKKTKSIEFRMDKYYTETVYLQTTINGWYFGNLILGGIPGMAVDLISGGYINLPDKVEATLKKE